MSIISKIPEGEHIPLTCKRHRYLRWSTKNIGGIGSRNIFFFGVRIKGSMHSTNFMSNGDIEGVPMGIVHECQCSGKELVPVGKSWEDDSNTDYTAKELKKLIGWMNAH